MKTLNGNPTDRNGLSIVEGAVVMWTDSQSNGSGFYRVSCAEADKFARLVEIDGSKPKKSAHRSALFSELRVWLEAIPAWAS